MFSKFLKSWKNEVRRERESSKLVSNFRAQAPLRAQGTIEYLMIIAVVVVISLVVVGLVVTQVGNSSDVSGTSSEIKQKVGVSGLSLTSSVAGVDGNGLLVLKNIDVENLVLTKIVVDGVDHEYSAQIVAGDEKSFKLQEISSCVGEKKNYSVQVEFVSASGLTKTANFGNILLDCTSVVTPVGVAVEQVFNNVAPSVELSSPVDDYSTAETRISFVFTPSDSDGTIQSCSLNLTDLIDANSSSSIVADEENTLEYTLPIGSYDWNISCTDDDEDTNTSETRTLTIVSNLVAHYLMNDNAASTVVIDSSSKGVNAIMSSQNTSSRTTTGLINSALTFQTGEYFGTTGSDVTSALSSNAWSITFWAKRAVTNVHSSWLNFLGNTGYAYYNKDNGQMKWHIGNAELGGVTTFAANTWAHWAFVRNGSTFTLYKNGISLVSGTNSSVYSFTGINIGGGVGDPYVNTRTLDDVRIYNKALIQDEILVIYNSGNGTEEE